MNFPVLLAEFAPIDPGFQLNLWNVLVLVIAIASLLTALKRKPPLDSELTRLNLAIESLTKTVGRLEDAHQGHSQHAAQLEALHREVDFLKQRREEDGASQRRHLAETVRELTDTVGVLRTDFTSSLDRFRDSMANNTAKVERALGGVEGELKQLTIRVDSLEQSSP